MAHFLLNLQNHKGMPLYKEFISEQLSRAQTQCISKFYMKNYLFTVSYATVRWVLKYVEKIELKFQM